MLGLFLGSFLLGFFTYVTARIWWAISQVPAV